jgi:hypothetical protein
MYLCVRGIVVKPVPSQESEWSCICVRGIVTKPVPSQESEQSCTGLVTIPLIQIHDHSLSWLGTGLVTIPITHKYMIAHFPGFVEHTKQIYTNVPPMTYVFLQYL